MKTHLLLLALAGAVLAATNSYAQDAENSNPYAIFGCTPYVAGDKDAEASAEKVFVIENFTANSPVARIEHAPRSGHVRLLDKHGKLLKEKWLKAGENGWPTQDRFAEKYYSISPYAYCAGNPIRYIDMNGDSINVADEHREQFNKDLIKVFGENASMFLFDEFGNLIFNGKPKKLTKDQRVAYKGMMGSKERYNIMYTNTYTTQSGITYDVNKDYGGALFDAEANNIVISPTPTSGTVITMALQNEYIKQTTTTNLFHEFGEVNQGVNQYRGGAIDYENTIRRILKMKPPHMIYIISLDL